MKKSLISVLPLLLFGCGQDPAVEPEVSVELGSVTVAAPVIESNPNKNAYFGDTHIHTVLSFDAYLMGTRRTPDEAYEFAKGGAIEHASGFMMQMKKPVDFLAVSHHAFYLGMMRELNTEGSAYRDHSLSDKVRGATSAAGAVAGRDAQGGARPVAQAGLGAGAAGALPTAAAAPSSHALGSSRADGLEV